MARNHPRRVQQHLEREPEQWLPGEILRANAEVLEEVDTAVVADTFAKWALRGRISLAGSGYGIPAPASIEDWGRPLGLLAAQLNAR